MKPWHALLLIPAGLAVFGTGYFIGLATEADSRFLDAFWTWVYPVWPILGTQVALTAGQIVLSEWQRKRPLR